MPEWGGFAFQDATDGIYVSATILGSPLPSIGQRLEIHGRSAAGNFAPIIAAKDIKFLGPGTLPKAEVADWQYISSGACDNDYVAVEGIVRSVASVKPPRWSWPATLLRIDMGGNLIWVYMRDATSLHVQELPGASVRVRGTCTVRSNARRQFESNAVLSNSAADLQIISVAPRDPFSIPLSSMNRLFVFRRGQRAQGQVRITGTATLSESNRVVLQDGTNAVQVRSNTTVAIQRGECVEAVGFPSPGAYAPILEDAIVRRCATPRAILPLEIDAGTILSRMEGSRPALPDGILVRATATVLDISRPMREVVLTLQNQDVVFAARLTGRYSLSDIANVQENSLVTITGVCLIQVDETGLPRSFEILLRSPNDIHVISRPSWLTRSLALKTAAALLAAACLALLWIVLLRSRVKSQTAIIEQQLKKEAALEERLRELVEHATDMVCIVDEAGALLHLNYGMERLIGYSRQELMKKNFFELLSPEQRDDARKCLADEIRHRPAPEPKEWRFLKKDGREITVEINKRFQSGPDGKLRIEAIGRDVTARKQAMFEYQELFRTLADNIPQLAWIADSTGSITWFNQRWFEFTGSTFEQAKGWGWRAFHHPEHVDRIVALVKHCVETGEDFEDTFPIRGRDGQFRWFLGRAVAIRDSKRKIVRWFGTLTDITEHKWIQSELQRSNSDLIQFAYVASHDLQEPLRNIGSFAQLLAKSFKNGDVSRPEAKYLEVITSSVRRMEALITDLLAYSRATGTEAIDRPATDLQAVFDTSTKNLEASIRQSGAVITHDPLPTINANPVHLSQVFQNLLGNAIKYRRPDVPLKMHVGARRQVDDWLFFVRDNGSGFAPEYADRVFGIFKRLHGRDVPGTGIGLAICKAMIERHGGHIWADARPNEGATFYFTIPDAQPSQTETAPSYQDVRV
jgi:PAS domain S-box-containing protein